MLMETIKYQGEEKKTGIETATAAGDEEQLGKLTFLF